MPRTARGCTRGTSRASRWSSTSAATPRKCRGCSATRARRAPGIGWLLVDYRGYGSSGGSPSEKALGRGCARAGTTSMGKPYTDASILFGRSLGSGVAVQLAAQRPVAGVILVAPFDSLVERRQAPLPLPAGELDAQAPLRFGRRCAPAITAPLLCIVADARRDHPGGAFEAPVRRLGRDRSAGSRSRAPGTTAPTTPPNYWPSIREFLE